jgi:hypothetical protein
LKKPIDFDLQELRTIALKAERSSPFLWVSSPYRWPLRSVFLLTALICGVLFIIGRVEPSTGFVAYVSALAFGGALVVSLSTVFITRYAIPLDVLMTIVAVLGIWLALRALLRTGKALLAVHAEAAPRLNG